MTQSTPPARSPISASQVALILLIVSGVFLTTLFGFRVFRSYTRLHRMGLKPGEMDVGLIRGWMTIPYIAKAYRVPPQVIYTGLNIAEGAYRHRSLNDINRAIAPNRPGWVLNQVKDMILTYQAQHPPHVPTPTPLPIL
jgi:hypothetical protein